MDVLIEIDRMPHLDMIRKKSKNAERKNPQKYSRTIGRRKRAVGVLNSQNTFYGTFMTVKEPVKKRKINSMRNGHAGEHHDAIKLSQEVEVPKSNGCQFSPVLAGIAKFRRKQKLSICHAKLGDSDINTIVQEFREVKPGFGITKLKLRDCGITSINAKQLTDALSGHQVNTIDFSANLELSPDTLSQLLKATAPKHVILSECRLTLDENLTDALFGPESSVQSLDISHNGFVLGSLAQVLTEFVTSKLFHLIVVDCGITSKQLCEAAKNLHGEVSSSPKALDLGCNDFDGKEIKTLALILSRSHNSNSCMKKLSLSDCGINASILKEFVDSFTGEVEELDLSDNPLGDAKACQVIQKTVQKLRCKRISLNSCDIVDVKAIENEKPSDQTTFVEVLDLGGNLNMNAKSIGDLATEWQVESLLLKNCSFTSKDIRNLLSGLAKGRKEKLNILDVEELTEIPYDEKKNEVEKLHEVAQTVKYLSTKNSKT